MFPYVLVLFFEANAMIISALFAVTEEGVNPVNRVMLLSFQDGLNPLCAS